MGGTRIWTWCLWGCSMAILLSLCCAAMGAHRRMKLACGPASAAREVLPCSGCLITSRYLFVVAGCMNRIIDESNRSRGRSHQLHYNELLLGLMPMSLSPSTHAEVPRALRDENLLATDKTCMDERLRHHLAPLTIISGTDLPVELGS